MIAGIIAEFNPFHRGHAYLIAEAKRLTGADCVIVVMSGDFVQRGAPAMCDKYSRCRMALEGGADIVLELPVAVATGSAELFAEGAVKLLASLGIVDVIVFGSESGDIEVLSGLAEKMLQEDDAYKQTLKQGLKEGLSFPKAREIAVGEGSEILNNPNNILAIEYCKAIARLKALPGGVYPAEGYKIPGLMTVKRIGAGYHDLPATDDYASATAVRKLLIDASQTRIGKGLPNIEKPCADEPADIAEISRYTTEAAASIIEKEYGISLPICEDDFSDMLTARLWTAFKEGRGLADIMDVTRGLEGRIAGCYEKPIKFSELALALKTKNITYSAVSRALLHILLGTKKSFAQQIKATPVFPYARLLGLKEEHSKTLRQVSSSASLSLITKLARADGEWELLDHDVFASSCYKQAVYSKFGTKLPGEYETSPVIIS